MKKALTLFLFVALALLGSDKPQNAKHKLSTDARTIDAFATARVIVQWKITVGAETTGKIDAVGGVVVSEFKSVRQGVYLVPGLGLSTLSSDPDVKYISLDRQVKNKLSTTAATIGARQAWNSGFTGTGIGVAIIDSGMNPDKNLGDKSNKSIVYTEDFTPSAYIGTKRSPSYGADWYGHGQHVAGIISSSGDASTCRTCWEKMAGIAPGASLIDLKVLDSYGEGTDGQVIAAIDKAITLKATYNIRVINISLGRPVYESYTVDPLCQAVEAAWKAGIVVVVSAGNAGRDNTDNSAGYGTIMAPGNDPYVITVGAMKTMHTPGRSDDLMASYSSKGPTALDHIAKPDLVAPGNLIISLLAQNGTMPLTNPQNAVSNSLISWGPTPTTPAVGGSVPTSSSVRPPDVNFGKAYSSSYYMLSGTSMAAPVVSGAAADILQAHPTFTPDQGKVLLMRSASKTFPASSSVMDDLGNVFTDYYDLFTVGAGYLDLQAAMQQAADLPQFGNSLSPMTTYDAASGKVYITVDSGSAWADSSVLPNKFRWGANSVWNASVLDANVVLWNSKARWGATTDQASKALWGVKCRWGASALGNQSALTSAESVEVTGEN